MSPSEEMSPSATTPLSHETDSKQEQTEDSRNTKHTLYSATTFAARPQSLSLKAEHSRERYLRATHARAQRGDHAAGNRGLCPHGPARLELCIAPCTRPPPLRPSVHPRSG